MKAITFVLAWLLIGLTIAPAQTLKQLERKARKTYKRGAFGMALYYSQAVLRLDSTNAQAQQWASVARKRLLLPDPPSNNPSGGHASIVPIPDFINEDHGHTPPVEKPDITLIVRTFNALDSSALNGAYIGVTNDGFGKGMFFQTGPGSNEAVFRLPAGAFYSVTGTKSRYSSGSATISAGDKPVADTLIRQLYLSPAWGLPVELYFDYQKPNALHPADTTTNVTYEDSWLDYLYRIDEYIDSNTLSNSIVERAKAQTETGLFFSNHVDGGFQKMKPLCELLEGYLAMGYHITLSLEARAGPLEKDEHTHALLSRRLNSIENYFSFYNNGVFQPWLADGHFKIMRQYVKEENMEENGRALSPFSLEAAKSRKVTVKMAGLTSGIK